MEEGEEPGGETEREETEARSKPRSPGGQRLQASEGEQVTKDHPDRDPNWTRPNQPAKEGRGLETGQETSTAPTRFRIQQSKWNASLLRKEARRETSAPQPKGGGGGEKERENVRGMSEHDTCAQTISPTQQKVSTNPLALVPKTSGAFNLNDLQHGNL